MAAAAPAADDAPKKGPGLIVQLAVLLALTAGAVGAGWFAGRMLDDSEPEGTGTHANAGEQYKNEEGSDKAAESLRIFRLEPITTNLADPVEVWARVELALVFVDRPDPDLAEVIHQDILAYLRTVKARQIEGPSGLQHLRSDLDERARVRSDGKVRQVLIRTLLFE